MRFTLDVVARRLAQHLGTTLPEAELTGAVLAPFTADEEPTLLFTRRAQAVANFPGEVSFPGGRRDPADPSLLATALRETFEEIGVPTERVEIVGRLDDHHVYGRHKIRSFVGFLDADARPHPAEAEVERIFLVPLADLAKADLYEGRRWVGDGGPHVVHYFRIDNETVWGATGRLVADLLSITLGWRPPRAPRDVSDYEEFRRDL